jgi:hypothetical protein
MDARAHVQAGLVRLLTDPAMWPMPDRQRFLHRLLDETGSDHRALAVLLVRAHELGIPAALDAEAARGRRWGESASPHILALTGEHFIVPDVARWVVESWGKALGHFVAAPPPPRPAPAPRPAGVSRASSATPSATRTARAATAAPRPNPPGTPGWVKPGKIPPVPRYLTAGASAAPPPPGSVRLPFGVALSRGEVAALAVIGLCYLGGMALLWRGMRSVRAADVAAARSDGRTGATASATSAADAAAAVAALRAQQRADSIARVVRAATPMPPVERRVGSAPNVRALAPDRIDTPSALVPDAMRPWRGAFDPARAGELVAGQWRVRADVHAVGGSRSCAAVWASLAPGRESVETLTVAPEAARGTDRPVDFAFASRPGLRGAIRGDGTFESVPLRSTREGVTYQFRMAGRFADGAFEAESETVTGTTLKYGDPQVCSVRSRLSGRRIGGL